MKFFSGTRGPKKRTTADLIKMVSELGKTMGSAPKQDTYKKMFEERFNKRMEKMREDYMSGKKVGFQLPGAKSDKKPKEMNKKAQQMLEMMAMRKASKDLKKQRRAESAYKSKLKNDAYAEQQKKYLEEQRLKMMQEQADALMQQQILEAQRSQDDSW